MRYLITGSAGFVGGHLVKHLKDIDPGAIIHCTDIGVENPFSVSLDGILYHQADLRDPEFIDEIVALAKPDRAYHLAAFSSVAFSWEHPAECFYNNNLIFINLVESLRRHAPSCRLLSVGSSEEYGNVDEADLPISEHHGLDPMNPYGVARVSQEMLSRVFAKGYSIDIRMTRSFNHIGPHQRDTFVIPGFVRQFAEAKAAGKQEFDLSVGDIDVIRDFCDVRDVVRAYSAILEFGSSGEVYNVCSGVGLRLRDVIQALSIQTDIKPNIVVDGTKIRPAENRKIIGDHAKITRECGWVPEIGIESSLADILDYWMNRVATQ